MNPAETREHPNRADWTALTLLALLASPLFAWAAFGAAFWTGFSPDGHVWTRHDTFVVFPLLFIRGVVWIFAKLWFLTIPWLVCVSRIVIRCGRGRRG